MEGELPNQLKTHYLELIITYNNINCSVVYQNLRKAWRRWVMIVQVLAKRGATVRPRGIMYKAVTQLVILYVSESWVVMGRC